MYQEFEWTKDVFILYRTFCGFLWIEMLKVPRGTIDAGKEPLCLGVYGRMWNSFHLQYALEQTIH